MIPWKQRTFTANKEKPLTYREWIEAMTIFAKYHEKGLDGYPAAAARHQEMWFGCKGEDISPEDLTRLEELGWSSYDPAHLMHRFI